MIKIARKDRRPGIKFFVLMSLLVPCALSVFSQGIRFEETLAWDQIIEKATAENKYIMVDVMATWCKPCREMERNVFARKEVGQLINREFIAVRLQADETRNDAEHVRKRYAETKRLIAAYKINAFPTILFLSPEGVLVHAVQGAVGATEFLQQAKNATDPARQYPTLVKMYNEGKRDAAFIDILVRKAWFDAADDSMVHKICKNFVTSLSDTVLHVKDNADLITFMVAASRSADRGFTFSSLSDKLTSLKERYNKGERSPATVMSLSFAARWLNDTFLLRQVVSAYFASLDTQALIQPVNIDFIKQFADLLTWREFNVILNNRKQINASMGDHYAERILCPFIHNKEIKPTLDKGGFINWDSIRSVLVRKYAEVGKEEATRSEFYHKARGDMDSAMPNAIAEAMAYFSVYGQYDITNMNAVAWYFFQHRTDKKELEAALQWAQTVIAHEPTTNHYDTYANLLYKLGRRGEAVKAMEKGFTLREGNGNMEEIKNNYEKMKREEPTWPSR